MAQKIKLIVDVLKYEYELADYMKLCSYTIGINFNSKEGAVSYYKNFAKKDIKDKIESEGITDFTLYAKTEITTD